MNRKRYAALTLALLLAVLPSLACGPPPREKLVKIAGYGLQLSAQLDANWTLPDTLLQQNVIDAAKHQFLRTRFENARRLTTAFNSGMEAVLATEKPDVASLASLVADMISEVQLLTSNVKGETYRKALLIIEISLRSIAGYFASQVKTARQAGYTDAALARYAALDDLRAIELYARGKPPEREGYQDGDYSIEQGVRVHPDGVVVPR